MKRTNVNLTKCISAWMMVLAMTLSMMVVPAKQVAAEEMVIADLLNGTTFSEEATVEYVGGETDDYLIEKKFTGLSSVSTMLGNYSNVRFEVVVDVESCSAGTPAVITYAMDGNYGNWAAGGSWNPIDSVPKTLTITQDLSSYSSLSEAGVRFAKCQEGATIKYTIQSARILGTAKGSSSEDSGTEGDVVTSGEVTIERSNGSGANADYCEWMFSITNHTSADITGVQIVIPTSGAVSTIQAFGFTAAYDAEAGGIIVYYGGTIPAGGTVAAADDHKVGYSANGVTTGDSYVKSYNCSAPAGSGTTPSDLQYELTGETKDLAYEDTPVGKHGKLRLTTVDGYSAPVIVDESGKPFQLRGASTHGMHWGEMHPYVNKGSFQSLRDEWGINMVRLVSYVTQGGYTEGSQALLDQKIQEGVVIATELGMYVIIDWHIHAENPLDKQNEAEVFFEKYATMYKDYDNVIFEICNEPTGVNWYNNGSGGDLYSYCKDIATIIRNCGSDALIVCGTNTWSQDVDDVAKKPLKDDGFENILYTFHFYSATHYGNMMDKVKTALAAGTPIFITEFGVCDASGNGNYDTANADAWIELADANNISFCCWSLCNKNESASYLKPSCMKTQGGWVGSDLTTTGIWLVNTCRAHQEKEENGAEDTTEESSKPDNTEENATTEAGGEPGSTEESGSNEDNTEDDGNMGGSSEENAGEVGTTEEKKTEENSTEEGGKPEESGTTEEKKTEENSTEEGGKPEESGTTEEKKTEENSTEEGGKPEESGTTEEKKTEENSTEEGGKPEEGGTTEEKKTEESSTEESGNIVVNGDNGSTDNNTTENESTGNNAPSNDTSAPNNTTTPNQTQDIPVSDIQIKGATKKVAPGKKIKLTAIVYPENASNQELIWKVSDTRYASVNPKTGVVKTKKAGKGKTVTVTVYSAKDNSVKATYTIRIMKKAVKRIKLSAKKTVLKKGQSVTVKASFLPAKGISKELTWTSSNKKVAVVNSKGKVTAKKKGTTKITAKAKDGSGKKASIKIRVK